MYRTCLLGSASVGKTSLVTQCLTSDYMNTYDASLGKSNVLVLNGHANERDFSFSSVYKSTRQRTLPRILQIFRFHINTNRKSIPRWKRKKLTTLQMTKCWWQVPVIFVYMYMHSIRFLHNNHPSPFAEVSLHLLIAVSSVGKASIGRRAEI